MKSLTGMIDRMTQRRRNDDIHLGSFIELIDRLAVYNVKK